MIATRRAGFNADGLILGLVIGLSTVLGIRFFRARNDR
jgi:hypothetical protein